MKNTIKLVSEYLFFGFVSVFSAVLHADTQMYEEANKIVDQIGYVGKAIDNNTYNTAFVIVKDPDENKSGLCSPPLIAFDAEDVAGKIMYSTLLGAKLSEQAVWVTFERDLSTGVCTLTGARAAD